MKKEYIMPLIYVHEIKPASLMTTSETVQDKDATGPGLGKGGWSWDDDEPEELDY